MERTFKLFCGFFIGCVLLLLPIPDFFSSISEIISSILAFVGFLMIAIFGVILSIGAVKAIFRK